MSYKVIHTIFDLLFPINCISCSASGAHICEHCSLVISQKSTECFFCGTKCDSDNICNRCRRLYPIDGIWWSWRYCNDKTKKIITAFKYRKKDWLSGILADHLIKVLPKKLRELDIITIPVPLFPRRERERGFNQARELAHHLPFKILDTAAIRTKDTLQQARTHSRRERYEHMKDAFAIKNPEKVTGKNILLIDDVATTGATLTTLAHTLKNAGAGKIYALVLAHG